MSSSEFVPLVRRDEPAAGDFRPFGATDPESAPGPEAEGASTAEGPGEAYQAGWAEGSSAARAELADVGASLARALSELRDFRTRLRERYEQELLELALGVARKVVQQELAARPEIWLEMIRAAVRRAVDRERIVLRVPPALARFLTESMPALRTLLDDVKELELREDAGLPAGGCVVESRLAEIDIGVESQLATIEEALVRSGGSQ